MCVQKIGSDKSENMIPTKLSQPYSNRSFATGGHGQTPFSHRSQMVQFKLNNLHRTNYIAVTRRASEMWWKIERGVFFSFPMAGRSKLLIVYGCIDGEVSGDEQRRTPTVTREVRFRGRVLQSTRVFQRDFVDPWWILSFLVTFRSFPAKQT